MLFIIAVVASGLQHKAEDGPRLTTCRQDGNVRKRTLRPNHVRAQFHDVVIAKDKAEDGPRLTTCRQGRECSQANASPEPRAGSIP